MTLAALIQFWPSALADPKPKSAKTETAETKAPKKSKKKKASDVAAVAVPHRIVPWQPTPVAKLMAEAAPEPKPDPITTAIKVAKAQIGKPYRWASTGPSSFDCSGLMLFSWRKAGVSLPRTSSAQRAALKHVPLEKMKPGDLVFAPGHVGMYLGKGKMVHAPRSGRHVEIAPLHSNAQVGGRVVTGS